METLKQLIDFQSLTNHKQDVPTINLVSELIKSFIYELEPHQGKLKYSVETIRTYYRRNYHYQYKHVHQHKGFRMTYVVRDDIVNCAIHVKETYDKTFTYKLRFDVDNEETAKDYLLRLYNYKHVFFNNRKKVNHYIPKKKDRCKLREFNDYVNLKGSYKKVAAYDRDIYRYNLPHSKNRTDERNKLSKLKLNSNELYHFYNNIIKECTDWSNCTNVMWESYIENEDDLKWYNKLKRK